MAEPISTTSGKTARAQIAKLRQAREKQPTYEDVIAQLEAQVFQASVTINAMRNHFNALRLVTVQSRQLIAELKKVRAVDIPL